LFSTSLEIQLHGAGADTFLKIYNNADTQYYQFTWSPTLTNVLLNPNAWTICKLNGLPNRDTTLNTEMGTLPVPYNTYPNPTATNWKIDNLPEHMPLTLLNASGAVIWEGRATKGTTTIPGEKLPAGQYLLKMDTFLHDSITLLRL
jgi:hypothetical protein